jgi:ankyrin repeat protein
MCIDEMKDQCNKKLKAVLQSASDRLFPAEIGEAKVCLDSRNRDGDNALHVFIWGEETENALFLIEHGIDINAVGDRGETPLHAAIHQNNTAVIRALLKADARTDIVSEFGKTAMGLAQEKGIKIDKIP